MKMNIPRIIQNQSKFGDSKRKDSIHVSYVPKWFFTIKKYKGFKN